MPGESRQCLFVLTPSPRHESEEQTKRSTFLPAHAPGTVLPLGRLDLQWRSGDAHDVGRLQTSTLNRRISPAQQPIVQAPQGGQSAPGRGSTSTPTPTPSRTLSAHPPSPSPASAARSPSPRPPPKDGRGGMGMDLPPPPPSWDFDLVVLSRPRSVKSEEEFALTLRVGVRSAHSLDDSPDESPSAPILALQYLAPTSSSAPIEPKQPIPTVTLDTPSRPGSRAGQIRRTDSLSKESQRDGPQTPLRPFSPLSEGGSRPLTPVSAQLRQATTSFIGGNSTPMTPVVPFATPTTGPAPSSLPSASVAFPPPPTLPPSSASGSASTGPAKRPEERGSIEYLGTSLIPLSSPSLEIVEERSETTYSDPIAPLQRWEGVLECSLSFIAFEPGLAAFGGVRVLVLGDEQGGRDGYVGKEWLSLGDLWVGK